MEKRFCTILMITVIILQLVCLVTYGQETADKQLTPTETVQLWYRCYGTALMDQCGPITTAHMRDDAPITVWVYDTYKGLKRLGYKVETSEVLEEKINGEVALVAVQTRSVAGGIYADQKEILTLRRINGKWLIDDLIVGDEQLEKPKKQL